MSARRTLPSHAGTPRHGKHHRDHEPHDDASAMVGRPLERLRIRRINHPTDVPIPYPIAAQTPMSRPWISAARGISDGATLTKAPTAAPIVPASDDAARPFPVPRL